MMNLLVRAKMINKDKWIYGYYVKYVKNDKAIHCIITQSYKPMQYINGLCIYEIDENTLCSCIDHMDKNGALIFNGDILRGENYPFKSEGKYNYFVEVIWFSNSPAFGILTHRNPKANVAGISDGNTDYLENFDSGAWEVIGNIFDNPELIEISRRIT